MKQVTQKEFYDCIGPKDVILKIENPYKYPYTTIFYIKNTNILVGKIIGFIPENSGLTESKYYLMQ